MMDQIKKLTDLVTQLQSGTATAQDIAKQVRNSLPPQFQALIKNGTPESVIAMLEPVVGSFVGKDAVVFLKSETSVNLIGEVLVILQADDA